MYSITHLDSDIVYSVSGTEIICSPWLCTYMFFPILMVRWKLKKLPCNIWNLKRWQSFFICVLLFLLNGILNRFDLVCIHPSPFFLLVSCDIPIDIFPNTICPYHIFIWNPRVLENSNLGVSLDIVATNIYYLIRTEQFIFYHPTYISVAQYIKFEARTET